AALETGNIPLAHNVAECLQMDPKEYLALLNRFKSYSPKEYQLYHIDVHLGKYRSALNHIAKCVDHFEEAIKLIEERELYSQAVLAFHGTPNFTNICNLVASNLEAKHCYGEASLLYRKAANFKRAFECHQFILDWKAMIDMYEYAEISAEELKRRLAKVSIRLEEDGRFFDAAEALSFSGKKEHSSKIVKLYCQGGNWRNATEFSLRFDEVVPVLNEQLRDRYYSLKKNIMCWRAELERHCNRLQVVRSKKKAMLQAWADGDFEENDVQSEAFSDASSMISSASRASRMSTASSRRRKHVEK
ncbi:hypothetical protein AB6A40_010871, partial [Gnathostoma spinigerum]